MLNGNDLLNTLKDLVSVRNAPDNIYHVSFVDNLPQTLEPRLPNGSELATGEEKYPEPDIDRVSFAETMTGAIRAIYPNIAHLVEKHKGEPMTLHVYSAMDAKKCRMFSPEILTQQKFVWDAHYTGEWWSTDPIKIKYVGKIEVHFDIDKPWAQVHPFNDKSLPAKEHSPEYITIVEK